MGFIDFSTKESQKFIFQKRLFLKVPILAVPKYDRLSPK